MVSLGSRVYRELGDYGSILPAWLRHPGVLPYVDETAEGFRGFILVGFYTPEDTLPGAFVADLLAIAVEPHFQRRGVGRGLLAFAVEIAETTARSNNIPEMRLTVAETNVPGQRLFESSGFVVLNAEHGSYDGGQRAIRMRLPLETKAASARIRKPA